MSTRVFASRIVAWLVQLFAFVLAISVLSVGSV